MRGPKRVRITDRTFDADHPNPEHLPSVCYDPGNRCALVRTPHGDVIARLGDWIVEQPDGTFAVEPGA